MDEIHGKRENGTVQIRVDGDLTGKTADSIISGGHLEAEISGNFGAPDDRMTTDIDSIKVKADNIYLDNISDKMEIRGMTAEDIDIIARGDVSGKDVDSSNLVIRSNGHTGYEDNPLLIHVSGNVDISSAYGEVHYVNSYRKVKPSKKPDKNNGDDQNSGKRPEQETDRKPQQKPSSEKEEEKKSGQDIPNQKTKGIPLSVKTGDSTPTEVNLYLALLSLAAVILLLKEKRRKNR